MDGVTYRPKAEVSVNYTRADAGGPRLGFFSLLFVWNFDWIGLNWLELSEISFLATFLLSFPFFPPAHDARSQFRLGYHADFAVYLVCNVTPRYYKS